MFSMCNKNSVSQVLKVELDIFFGSGGPPTYVNEDRITSYGRNYVFLAHVERL